MIKLKKKMEKKEKKENRKKYKFFVHILTFKNILNIKR